MTNLWTCPKCRRQFVNKNQVHSCRVYPVEKHLQGKSEEAQSLYKILKEKIKKEVGSFRIESLPCCIHFVKDPAYTFAAVYILKNKIRVHFGLGYQLVSPRIEKFSQMSANRWLYSLGIRQKEEIDKEFLNWLKQAYDKQ